MMSDFLDKYYPGLSQKFALKNIKQLEELIEDRKKEYKKKYGEIPE